jgi:acyl carrier protein
LDSVAQVHLLLHLEKHFGLRLPIENLEIDSFVSVASIAELVANYSQVQADRPASIEDLAGGRRNGNGALVSRGASEVDERGNLIREIQALFEEKLSIQVEAETNLFETGVLDSMTLVQFILHLEEKFAFHLPMEDLEGDSFRSVMKIAELVATLGYYTHERADYVVVEDLDYEQYFAAFRKKEPEISSYVIRLLKEEYTLVYANPSYRIYARH